MQQREWLYGGANGAASKQPAASLLPASSVLTDVVPVAAKQGLTTALVLRAGFVILTYVEGKLREEQSCLPIKIGKLQVRCNMCVHVVTCGYM